MALSNDNSLVSIPRFFHRSKNRLYCHGVQITDAAQGFADGETYLYLKFITPKGNRNNIPKSFTNKDMRMNFAVYTSEGTEVAFRHPVVYTGDMRLKQQGEYLARWTIARDNNRILNNIRCANRRHYGWVLNANGKYEAFPD